MIKKYIFIVLAMFGVKSMAMSSDSDHMADMMSMANENVQGAFTVKAGILEKKSISYELSLGWTGAVNDHVQWGVSLNTDLESKKFQKKASLAKIYLSEAFIKCTPTEGMALVVGKKQRDVDFNKTGVLYDSDLYTEGVSFGYTVGDKDSTNSSIMVSAYLESDDIAESIVETKIATQYVDASVKSDVSASVWYDGIGGKLDNPYTQITASVSSGMFPVGVFGVYTSQVKGFMDTHSFNAGIYAGYASTSTSGEVNDFGVSVSYYSLNKQDYLSQYVDTNYVEDEGKGIAVRVQYNLVDNMNVVAKYAYNLDESENKLVAEINYNF